MREINKYSHHAVKSKLQQQRFWNFYFVLASGGCLVVALLDSFFKFDARQQLLSYVMYKKMENVKINGST